MEMYRTKSSRERVVDTTLPVERVSDYQSRKLGELNTHE
jgi:hypothetical protein